MDTPTTDTAAALAALDEINAAGGQWFIPKSQAGLPTDGRIRYKIRGLVGCAAMDVDFVMKEDGRLRMTATGGTAALRDGLLGWANMLDANGVAIEFDTVNWKANVERMNPLHCMEVSREIWDRTFMSEDARKN